MMMEMFLDEQKAKENNIDIEECYLKIVDKWYFRYEGDTIEYREDALESYYRIKARYANFT